MFKLRDYCAFLNLFFADGANLGGAIFITEIFITVGAVPVFLITVFRAGLLFCCGIFTECYFHKG